MKTNEEILDLYKNYKSKLCDIERELSERNIKYWFENVMVNKE